MKHKYPPVPKTKHNTSLVKRIPEIVNKKNSLVKQSQNKAARNFHSQLCLLRAGPESRAEACEIPAERELGTRRGSPGVFAPLGDGSCVPPGARTLRTTVSCTLFLSYCLRWTCVQGRADSIGPSCPNPAHSLQRPTFRSGP